VLDQRGRPTNGRNTEHRVITELLALKDAPDDALIQSA
jgi:hypothetical protein